MNYIYIKYHNYLHINNLAFFKKIKMLSTISVWFKITILTDEFSKLFLKYHLKWNISRLYSYQCIIYNVKYFIKNIYVLYLLIYKSHAFFPNEINNIIIKLYLMLILIWFCLIIESVIFFNRYIIENTYFLFNN